MARRKGGCKHQQRTCTPFPAACVAAHRTSASRCPARAQATAVSRTSPRRTPPLAHLALYHRTASGRRAPHTRLSRCESSAHVSKALRTPHGQLAPAPPKRRHRVPHARVRTRRSQHVHIQPRRWRATYCTEPTSFANFRQRVPTSDVLVKMSAMSVMVTGHRSTRPLNYKPLTPHAHYLTLLVQAITNKTACRHSERANRARAGVRQRCALMMVDGLQFLHSQPSSSQLCKPHPSRKRHGGKP